MTFWEIREPAGSDYKHVHVSGKLDHPFRLPAAHCEDCGSPVCRYYDVVIPFECPISFRKNSLLTDSDADVSLKDFRKIAKQISSTLPKSAAARIVPEARLQPGFLDVPSIPKDDFLWSDLLNGLSSMVVSERVRHVIKELAPEGVELYPVLPRRIGKRLAKSAPRIPDGGEPEDMLKEFKAAKKPLKVPAYYQVLVSAEADYPAGAEPRSRCEFCGEEKAPNWKAKDTAWESLTSKQVASLSKGLELFRIPERGTVFVTDRVKAALERLAATNVSFRPFPAEPSSRAKRRS